MIGGYPIILLFTLLIVTVFKWSATSVRGLECASIGSSPYFVVSFYRSDKILLHRKKRSPGAGGDANFNIDVLDVIINSLL